MSDEAREKAIAWAEYLRTHGVSTSATVGEIKREAFMVRFGARALLASQPEATEKREALPHGERGTLEQLIWKHIGLGRSTNGDDVLAAVDAILAAGYRFVTRPVSVQEEKAMAWDEGRHTSNVPKPVNPYRPTSPPAQVESGEPA